MKIEKISDKRLKILLTLDDLRERGIKMSELALGTNGMRVLFREIMDIACDKYDFYAEDSQLMVEAIPLSLEAIIILVTKIDDDIKEKNENNDVLDNPNKKFFHTSKPNQKKSSLKKSVDDNLISIFCFNKMDDVALVSRNLFGRFTGESYLLKLRGNYFLVLRNNSSLDEISDKDLEIIIGEYGVKQSVNVISYAYLFEHGELIIDNPAIDILKEYL